MEDYIKLVESDEGCNICGAGHVANIVFENGTGIHSLLAMRDAQDAHPISSITGLQSQLNDLQTATTAVDAKINQAVGQIADGAPLVAEKVAGMTDQSRMYVNLEDGYIYRYQGLSENLYDDKNNRGVQHNGLAGKEAIAWQLTNFISVTPGDTLYASWWYGTNSTDTIGLAIIDKVEAYKSLGEAVAPIDLVGGSYTVPEGVHYVCLYVVIIKDGVNYHNGHSLLISKSSDTIYVPYQEAWVSTGIQYMGAVVSDGTITPEKTTFVEKMDDSTYKLSDNIMLPGASSNDYTSEDKLKLEGIEENAQVNVIESVQVNGTTLEITDKTVNIGMATTDTFGLIKLDASSFVTLEDGTTLVPAASPGADGLIPAADYAKLISVEKGAQVNQKAFGCIQVYTKQLTPNDVHVNGDKWDNYKLAGGEATTTTSTYNIVPGDGIILSAPTKSTFGNLEIAVDTSNLVLTDTVTSVKYRLVVTNGVLGIEEVV